MAQDQTLTEGAQDALAAALRSGALREGQFVSMSHLVDILGVPIAAVRDAVRIASWQGLMETLPKRGVRIMEVTPAAIEQALDFRMALDQEGARRRIRSGRLDGLAELRDRHLRLRDAAAETQSGDLPLPPIDVDLSLHDYLASGLDNPHLSADYASNRLRIAVIQNARPFLRDRVRSAMEEHLAILDALEARDESEAVSAIARHCQQTLRWWGVV